MNTSYDTYSVFVALVGRPTVGKSSLTNRLVGEKVAIVTNKPQTTRTRITGVVTRGAVQYVLLDTPGVHKARTKLGGRMDKTASDSLADVDVTLMLFEPYGELNESEQSLIRPLRSSIKRIRSRTLPICRPVKPSWRRWACLVRCAPFR